MPEAMKEVYAYLGKDPEGNEGFVICVIKPEKGDPAVVQLVAPNREIADQYRMYAESVVRELGQSVRLVRFTNAEELEVIS